jgi:hypothetical protein
MNRSTLWITLTHDHGHMKASTKGVPPQRTPSDAELQDRWDTYD